MDEFDLISIGDATWDVFITPSESDTLCEINTKDCLLCFNYGDKIPVKNLDFSVGGNAANNAVGASRLGIKVAPIFTLGDDETSDQIVNKLIKERVNTDYISRAKNTSANYSTAITVSGERTLFTYKSPVSYKFPDELPKVEWVYLTSTGDGYEDLYNKVLEWVEKKEIKLAYNPGSRQLRASADENKKVFAQCYILYVNRKEAEMLTNLSSTQGKEKDLLVALAGLGPKLTVVTDGGNGAFVYDREKFYHCPVLPVDSFERTGAGDSFGSGFLSALIKGKTVQEAMVWGTVNSASVIGYSGAQRGLLNENDMKEWLERAQSCQVVASELT